MGLYGSPQLHPTDSPPAAGASTLWLPDGAALAPGETVLLGYSFRYSTIAFYLHTRVALTNRRLYAARPNTLFGLIPVGTGRSAFPIANIAGVGAATRFSLVGLLLGVVAGLIGFAAVSSSTTASGGVVWLVIGALLILAAPKQAIEVMNSGGGAIRFPVSVLERSRTIEFANRVSQAVAHTMALPTPSGANPGDALRHLSRLRDQGLVTDDEYAAKRAEILARL